VHWPLYAFATNAFLGRTPTTVALLLMPISLGLGHLQYRYVEKRFQYVWPNNNSRYLGYIIVASLVLSFPVLLHSAGAVTSGSEIDFAWRRRINFGLSKSCEYEGDFDNRSQCRLSGDPRVALWGDSLAMQWGAGLADALHGRGLIQITKSGCGPIGQLAPISGGSSSGTIFSREWAATCIRFNKSALHYILTTDSINTVVLSSTFGYMGASNFLVGDKIEQPDIKTLRREFLATLSALRGAQKSVIVIAPAPNPGNTNIGECLERTALGVFIFPILRSDCSFSYNDYLASERTVIEFLRTLEVFDQLYVVWPESVTCNHETCAAQIGGTALYRDGGHITYDASIMLTRMLHIADKLALPLPTPAASQCSLPCRE
jgi:hypothetical protein